MQSDPLILADAFGNFRNKLDVAHFVSARGLSWQTALKKTKVKLALLTDIDMLLMIEKSFRGRMCHTIHDM